MTYCGSPEGYDLVFSVLLLGYYAILIAASFFFILCNLKVHSIFRDDTVASFRALILSILPFLLEAIGIGVLVTDLTRYEVYWWIIVIGLVIMNIVSQMGTFFTMVKFYCSVSIVSFCN